MTIALRTKREYLKAERMARHMAEQSLYELILANINDGILPEDFMLPKEQQPGGFAFADGARDGMCRYHMIHSGLDAAGTKMMAKALRAAAKANYNEADHLFTELGKSYLPINIVDDFQSYIIDHANKLPANNVYCTAVYLVLHSQNKEAVKFGIEMLELFSSPNNQTKSMIRNVGLSDEFTIFAIWAMQKWENGNEEVFELAKKVRSWGKIHSVEALSPDTQEIRDWLFMNGVYNSVQEAYSALTVWEKADVADRLQRDLTEEEFTAATDIVEALLNEGPVPGISRVNDAETHILNYLHQAKQRKLAAEAYDMILTLHNWAEDQDAGFESVKEITSDMLKSEQCRKAVMDAVKEGKSLRLADSLGVPYRAELLQCMKDDFSNHFYNCRYLMDAPEYVDTTVRLFEERIPLEKLQGELRNDVGFGEDYEITSQLDFILQELRDKPFTGIRLVIAGLNSPTVRNRNGALRVLQGWTAEKHLPLKDLSADLYEAVESLKVREISDGPRETIEKLLNGEIYSEADDEENEEDE